MNPRYVAVSKVAGESSKIEQPLRPRRACRYWSRISLSWFTGILWLVPIILLLYFNFTTYIIGPSASCPPGGCKADPLAASGSHWAQGLDYNDHNTLGGLQLVAKVLELWFLFIATSVVYNIAMFLASNGDGLPVGLLSTPWEFAGSRSLWESFRAVSRGSALLTAKDRPPMSRRIHLFVGFLALMCLLVNLMGPAVAVLVLPALRWVDLPRHAQHSFNISGIDRIRVAFEWKLQRFPNCTDKDLMDRRYSCTSLPYASSLDFWADSLKASGRQGISSISESQSPGISAEADVFFTFNVSVDPFVLDLFDVAWAPNRQALPEVSADLDNFYYASQNLDASPRYGAYNRSLNTVLKRIGPIFRASGNTYAPKNTTRIIIGHEQEIRCYGGYRDFHSGPETIYTKCLRIGTTWNSTNKQAQFSVTAAQNNSLDRVKVSAFFSDQAAYFNETFNSDLILSSCFANGTVRTPENCTFDRVFTSPQPSELRLLSSNILNVELSMPQKFPNRTRVFEFFTFTNFSTYTLDTSPQTNSIYLIQVEDIPEIERSGLQSIPVDPDWLLAAWSVDHDGLVSDRSASLSLTNYLEALFGHSSSDNVVLENASEAGSSRSVFDSTFSFSPNSITAAPISTSTARLLSAGVLSGSGAPSSISGSLGMTPAASSFSDSALNNRSKSEEAAPTPFTTTSDDDDY